MNIVIENFKIPKGSAKYIALQRTHCQLWVNKVFRKFHAEGIYDRYFLPYLGKEAIKNRYFKELQEDYLGVKNALPPKVENILDVGCGMAGIDLFLYYHYRNLEPNLFLIDKEGTSEIFYGFKQEAAFYNSFELATEFLQINGVPRNKIHIIDVSTDPFPINQTFDLVVSFISWGFNYPAGTYIEDVHSALSLEGSLIIDVRKATNGESELKRKFQHVSVISEHKKHIRLICKKKKPCKSKNVF